MSSRLYNQFGSKRASPWKVVKLQRDVHADKSSSYLSNASDDFSLRGALNDRRLALRTTDDKTMRWNNEK